MVAALKILRSLTAGLRPPSRTYGEPYVNFSDMQFGVFNSSNVATDLLGVPIFSTTKSYAVGSPVSYNGLLYVANVAVSAGAWTASQWTQVTGAGSVTQNVQVFSANVTYTPSLSLIFAIVETIAGGGGGGSASAGAAAVLGGGGGGSGGYSRKTLTAAQIGASQYVTIGAGGLGGAAGRGDRRVRERA